MRLSECSMSEAKERERNVKVVPKHHIRMTRDQSAAREVLVMRKRSLHVGVLRRTRSGGVAPRRNPRASKPLGSPGARRHLKWRENCWKWKWPRCQRQSWLLWLLCQVLFLPIRNFPSLPPCFPNPPHCLFPPPAESGAALPGTSMVPGAGDHRML